MATYTTIDFNEAFVLFQKCKRDGDMNPIAIMLMPLAENMAASKSNSYGGGPLASSVDYDSCFSAAQNGIEEALRKLVPRPGATGTDFKNFVVTAIKHRLTDLERRNYKHIKTRTTEGEEGTIDYGHHTDVVNLPSDIEWNNKIAAIKHIMEKVLEPRQAQVMMAVIDNVREGKSWPQLAESLDMPLGTFKSTLTRARQRLDTQTKYSHAKELIADILSETLMGNGHAAPVNTR